jgi:DNA helicase-2/ATP-dependent DNA helicase PcrA
MGSPQEDERPLILSTIHRAKGLEWRVVFIPMLCEDHFPSNRVVGDDKAFEEERRVFYVAATRAKDQLYLISPAVVQRFGRYQTCRISEFVEELKPEVYKKSLVSFKSKKKKPKTASFKSALDLL